MTVEELKQTGAIYVENIKDGLEQYENQVVKLTKEEAESFFLGKLQETGRVKLFLDFYYFVVDGQARRAIDEQLTEAEKSWLKSFPRKEGEFIFEAQEELIRIAAKLNASEMLFSSLYLVGEDSAETWWGNYGEQYVVMRHEADRPGY